MIAKALGAGGGWSGKIDYLYEGKLEARQASDKQAEVILHSDNVRVPRDPADKIGRQAMKSDFIFQAQSHRLASRHDKTIGEHVLSFTTDDMRTLRNRHGMRQVAAEYVKLLGLDITQHVAILHQDTDNPHLHIVFNRVTDQGRKYKDSHEKRRALAAAVALSQKHGLQLVGNLKTAADDRRTKSMRAGMEDLKKLQQTRPIFSQARNVRHLGKLVEKEGMAFEEKGDRILMDGQEYKRTDLEAMFLANRNAKVLDRPPREKEAKAEELVEVKSSRAGIMGKDSALPDKTPQKQLKQLKTKKIVNRDAIRNAHPPPDEAGSQTDLKARGGHQGTDIRREGALVNRGKEKHPLPVTGEISGRNTSDLSGSENELAPPDRERSPEHKPARDGYAQYLAEVRRDIPFLQNATSFDEIEERASQAGITYQRDEDACTTIGERSFSDRVLEKIMAENAQRLREQPAETMTSVKAPQSSEDDQAQFARELADLENRLTARLSELEAVRKELSALEEAVARDKSTPSRTHVSGADSQPPPELKRANFLAHPALAEYEEQGQQKEQARHSKVDERREASLRRMDSGDGRDDTNSSPSKKPEYPPRTDQGLTPGPGYVGRMVSNEQEMAREGQREPNGKRRRQGGRRLPDHKQKIGKLKLSTDKSKKMGL